MTGPQDYRYYLHVIDEWGPEHPLAVIRVRGAGGATGEEDVACGGAWRPTQFAVERASRTQGYSALEVDADTAERAARRWAVSRASRRP